MMKPIDYAVIIPTHGRPGNVTTINTLRRYGYTGKIYLVCDDEDECLDEYINLYGEDVLVFSKKEYAGTFDKMDNFGNDKCVVFARNAIFDLAKEKGLGYIIVADDDYTVFQYRVNASGGYHGDAITKTLNEVFNTYFNFLINSRIDTICFAQGGDFIGGGDNNNALGYKRKMMNLFFFDTSKPIEFIGTLNEDLTSSVVEGQRGKVILTSYLNSIVQKETQSNAGGLTDIYLKLGTYVKSFYSVIAAPSCVRISVMGQPHRRIHHEVKWEYAVPKIIRDNNKKKISFDID